MDSRNFFKATTATAITFFSGAIARSCKSDEYIEFTDSSGIYYSILRYCVLGELAGQHHVDEAMDRFPRECVANLGVHWNGYYNIFAEWNAVNFGRGIGQNASSVFEECVIAIFNQAQIMEVEDSKSEDRWTSIGIGIFCSVLFLGFMTCVIGGLICTRQEKQKARAKAEEDKIHQVEEIVIEKLTHLPGEEPPSESPSDSSNGLPRPSGSQ